MAIATETDGAMTRRRSQPRRAPAAACVATTLAITVDDAAAARIAEGAGADVEHLEAHGVAIACAARGVPLAVVLGVANLVGARGRAEWLAHHERAEAAAGKRVLAWLEGGRRAAASCRPNAYSIEARSRSRAAIGTAARRGIERAAGRALLPPVFSLACAVSWPGVGCATEGKGNTPPLPGGPAVNGESDAVAGDDAAQGPPGDDGGGTGDDGGAAADEGGPATGGTCNDVLHGLKAFFVIPAVPCTGSSDCAAGDCCYVNGSASSCVMQ